MKFLNCDKNEVFIDKSLLLSLLLLAHYKVTTHTLATGSDIVVAGLTDQALWLIHHLRVPVSLIGWLRDVLLPLQVHIVL